MQGYTHNNGARHGLLRIGVAVAYPVAPAWAAACIQAVSAEPCLTLVGRVECPSSGMVGGLRGLHGDPGDQPARYAGGTDLRSTVDISGLLDRIPVLAAPAVVQASDPEDRVQAQGNDGPDALVWLAAERPNLTLAMAAKSGLWCYRFGGRFGRTLTAIGRSEVLTGQAQTECEVVQLAPDGTVSVRYRTVAATSSRSPRDNQDDILRRSVPLAARALRLYATGTAQSQHVLKPSPDRQHASGAIGSRVLPLPGAVKAAGQRALASWRGRVGHWEWNTRLAYGDTPAAAHVLLPWVDIPNPRNGYWADPMVIIRGHVPFVFVERYDYERRMGSIECLELGADLQVRRVHHALTEPFHVSYPCVFQADGELCMVPESASSRSIRLYVCVEFPTKWVLRTTLLDDVEALDPNVFRANGLWWLFASVHADGRSRDELYLFSRPSLWGGRWAEHRLNPVVSDARHGRGAGPLWRQDGVLFRPAQDGTPQYEGRAVRIQRIDELTTSTFHETQVGELRPSNHSRIWGMHTLSHGGNVIASDALRWKTSRMA
jgi:hypothetical protein